MGRDRPWVRRPASIDPDPGDLDDLGPFLDVLADEVLERAQPQSDLLHALARELLLDLRGREYRSDRLGEALDDLGWGAGRRQQADPDRGVEPGETRFGDRRQVGRHHGALRPRRGEDAHRTGLAMRP